MTRMYVCECCGDCVSEDNLPTYNEFVPYGEGVAWYEEVDNCSCGGNYVEAKVCAWCGEWAPKDICPVSDEIDFEELMEEIGECLCAEDMCYQCIKKILKEGKLVR